MGASYSNIGGTWHKDSKIYDNIGGTWHQTKNAYDNINGIWKQSYNSGIPAVFYAVGGSTDHGSVVATNLSTSDNLIINAATYATSNYAAYGTVQLIVKVYDSNAGTYSNGTSLFQCNGNLTISGNGNYGSVGISSWAYIANGQNDGSFGSAGGALYSTAYTYGTFAVNATNSIAYGTYSTHVAFSLIFIASIYASHSAGSSNTTFSIPWSSFTYLPTNQPLIYTT
jgi:hypothetical protein